MKLNKLAVSAGVAAAMMSGSALALSPAVTPDLTFYISGASAQQKTLGALLSSFCQAGTLDTYKDKPASGSAGKKWRSYFCTFQNSAPVPASLQGKNILINNRSKGGSVWGVVPVARGELVEYLNIFNSNCTSPSAGNYECTWESSRAGGLVGDECPPSGSTTDADTICRVSDGGVSDVEPAMFVGNNLAPGFTALTPAEIASLTVNSEYGVIFGISVTTDVADDLRSIQGLAPGATPSMTKQEIISILSGKITNWKDLNQGMTGAGSGFGAMTVCRRVNGSGTQAAQNAFFMESPCRTGENGGALPMVTAISSPVYTVVENSGSGDVIDCQNDAFNGVQVPGFAIGAIGFNAIEKQPGGSDKWEYIAIDGIEPTVANAVSGAYGHWFEQTIQWPTASTTGAALDLLNFVKDQSGDPAVIAAVPLNGVASLPQNGWVWDNPAHAPTMRGTRGNNSCKAIELEKDNP